MFITRSSILLFPSLCAILIVICQINSIIKFITFSISYSVTGVRENCQSIFYLVHANYALMSYKKIFGSIVLIAIQVYVFVCVSVYCTNVLQLLSSYKSNATQFAF